MEMKEIIYCLVQENETQGKFFHARRGLRQEDPFLPYLFIMVVENLGRSLLAMVARRKIMRVKLAMTLTLEALQQFVDDTFLYGFTSIREAKAQQKILNKYLNVLGNNINYQKCKFYFFTTNLALQKIIIKEINCRVLNVECP